jgi:hypothetical protein
MVDIAGLADRDNLGADDFQFRIGNDDNPGTWADAPSVQSISVRPGQGIDGADRITLVWPDNAIQNIWLQVTVLPTGNTGLSEPDVFYFGNAMGESGNSAADAKVNALDMLAARSNPHDSLNPAPIELAYDYNRDTKVDAVDLLIARNHQTHLLNALDLITVPGGKPAEAKPAPVAILVEGNSPDAALIQEEVSGELGIDPWSAYDAAFRQDMEQVTTTGRLSWLRHFTPVPTSGQSNGRVGSPSQVADELALLMQVY